MNNFIEHVQTIGLLTGTLTPLFIASSVVVYIILRDKLSNVFILKTECSNIHNLFKKDYLTTSDLYNNFVPQKEYIIMQEKTNFYLETMAKEFKEFKDDQKRDNAIINKKVDQLIQYKMKNA